MTSGSEVQIEYGNWAKVHNVILRSLAKTELTGREAKCLFFLLSMTYGNQKKEHEISLSLWASETNIDKRHIKPIIDRLIARGIMYRIEGKRGRGHTAVYGFNKYYGQWDSAEKVPPQVPFETPEKVPSEVPFIESDIEEKVPSTVPEKVPSTVPTKERKLQSGSLLADTESEQMTALVVLAYQTVCRVGPPLREAKGKADLIVAGKLIEHYGYAECVRSLSTLKERYNATIQTNPRGIGAPLPYLRTIMESELGAPVLAAPATVNFALEDITP